MSVQILGTAQVPKDPEANLDYGIDWTTWLAGDTIASSLWEITEGGPATLSNGFFDGTRTKIWVSGGTLKSRLVITNKITTAGGRANQRSLLIPIGDL